MYAAIIILIIIASVLLVLVILAQNSKGGGMSAQFGGSGANQMIGAQNTTNLLEKITWGMATAILVLTLGANFLIDRSTASTSESPNVEKAKNSSVPQNLQTPTPGTDTEDAPPNTDSDGGSENTPTETTPAENAE